MRGGHRLVGVVGRRARARWRRGRRRSPRRWRCPRPARGRRWPGAPRRGRWSAARMTLAVPANATSPTLMRRRARCRRTSSAAVLGRLEPARARRRWPPSTATRRWRARPWPARGAPCSSRAGLGQGDHQHGERRAASTAAGTWRRQPGRFGATDVEQVEVGEAHGVGRAARDLQRRRRPPASATTAEQQPQPVRRAGTSRDQRPAPRRAPRPGRAGAATKRTMSREPVAVGAQHEVVGAGAAERRRRCRPRWLGGGRGVALPQPRRRRSGPRGGRPVSGSTSSRTPDVGQLELAGVDDLDARASRGGRRAGAAACSQRAVGRRRGSR